MLNHDPQTSPGTRSAPTTLVPRPSHFSQDLLDHTERRRVRAADGLSPLAPPPLSAVTAARHRKPLALLWHLREVLASGTGSYRISVPLSGTLPSTDASATLQRILEQMWVHYPTSDLSAADSVSVVIGAADDSGDPHRHQLIVQLAVDPRADRRIDGTQMARHLRSALEQLASA